MSKADVLSPNAPPADAVLSLLYKSQRSSVQLSPGVSLSPVIHAFNGTSYKAMLAENWASRTEDHLATTSNTTPANPAFNPAAPEYNELARRVSMSAAMRRCKHLDIQIKQLEKQLSGLTGESKESKQQQLEEARQQASEAQTALSDLQASFIPDPLSLVPWMSALFAVADAGCSSFDTGGCGWPPQPDKTPLSDLLSPSGASAAVGGPAAASAWLYGGAEKVLGVFKRRYDLERGPGRVSIFMRLAINCFGDDSPAELAVAVETAVDRSRNNLLGAEATAAGASLDLVQLHWLDYQDRDFLPVLLALAKLACGPVDAASGTDGSAGTNRGKKVAAVGLVDPPAHAISAAVRAGVPLACVTTSYNLLDITAAPILQQCRSQGIKFFASGALAHGLISEAYLGVPAPNPAVVACPESAAGIGATTEAVGPDNLPAGLAMVARYGGWPRFQMLLSCLKGIADKHNVSVEVVALRWLIDQGTFPIAAVRWSASAGPWATYGHTYGLQHASAATADRTAAEGHEAGGVRPAVVAVPGAPAPFCSGIDAALFQVDSFLDAGDVGTLSTLCGSAS